MSRVGKKPIPVPSGVEVKIEGSRVRVKGSKGELEREFDSTMKIEAHDGQIVVTRPDGHLFNTITYGIRTMPAYGPQVPIADRWAIVAYVRALQRSQRGTLADVPAEARATLR